MKHSSLSGGLLSSFLVVAPFLVGCSEDPVGTDPMLPTETTPSGRIEVDIKQKAHGWASADGKVTNGGANADAAHTYTVTNRTELVKALYPDAVIADNGTFTSAKGPDATAKIIYVKGKISLSTDNSGKELALADYACPGYDFEAYKTAYDPVTWNKTLVDGKPKTIHPCPGSQEELRDCSRRNQRAVVQIRVGSNTSIVGLGDNAKIVHGHLIIGGPAANSPPPQTGILPPTPEVAMACGLTPPDPVTPPTPDATPTATNVVVRNITFEDAFDFFPAWDPADSYSTPPATADAASAHPLCQATLDEATGAGPNKCPGGRWNAAYDNITVQNATQVWIDHSTFNDGDRETQKIPSIWAAPYDQYANRVQPHDGALDINGVSDFVTVSRNTFRNHDKVMLIGGSDTVRDTNGWGFLSVTVHNNSFINCGQRMPRVRFGKVHFYSNLIQGARPAADGTLPPYPMTAALAVGHLAKVYSENNLFVVQKYVDMKLSDDADATAANIISTAHKAPPASGDTPDVGQNTYFFDKGSTLNGKAANLMDAVKAQVMKNGTPEVLATDTVWKPTEKYKYTAIAATAVRADTGMSGANKIWFNAP